MTRVHGALSLSAALLVVFLTGCAPVLERPGVTDVREAWEHRVLALSRYPVWGLKGRVGIRHGEDGWQAGLEWRQDGDDVAITLFDPLGRKVAMLNGDAGQVGLKTSQGNAAVAGNAEALMDDLLGWSLPVSGLRYWVRGLPAPNAGAGETQMEWDERGRVAHLEQDGWDIVYSEYEDTPGLSMPRVLRLRRGDVAVKLLVKEWQLSVV